MKLSNLIWIFCALSIHVKAFECSPYPLVPYISHNEGSGLGYKQGYSSLGLQYAPTWECTGNMQYLLDVRGHLFNNGDPAANAGIGARYIDHSRGAIYGANLYYDYRDTHGHAMQQIGIGLELLGKRFDFRMNGYLPFGRHKLHFGQILFVLPGERFVLSWDQERVMAGFDAEVGYAFRRRFSPCETWGVYGAVGPYFITSRCYSKRGTEAVGVRARVAMQLGDYIELEGRTTYDREFHWRGEGVITISCPFGWRSCIPADYDHLRRLAVQPVVRQEMVIVSKSRRIWED